MTHRQIESALRELTETTHGAQLDGTSCECRRCGLALQRAYQILDEINKQRKLAQWDMPHEQNG